MTDKRCASCKWWGNDHHGYEDLPSDFRQCARVLTLSALDPHKQNEREVSGELAFIENPAAWCESFSLVTREDFGCVLWEAKP